MNTARCMKTSFIACLLLSLLCLYPRLAFGTEGTNEVWISGQSGTCNWSIEKIDGSPYWSLIIEPQDGTSGVLGKWADTPPWYVSDYADPPFYQRSIHDVVVKGNVKARTCKSLFSGCTMLQSVDIKGLDTSEVTDMSRMFQNCSKLETLDVSSLDTSNVTTMQGMFWQCYLLNPLNLSNFNCSHVENFNGMFLGCKALTSLDLSGFVTSSATDMNSMFDSCESITTLNLSSFDTTNVSNMGDLFNSCTNLVSVDMSSFDTSSVKNMARMFYQCPSLQTVDLSTFSTPLVTNVYCMFYGCTALRTIFVGDEWELHGLTQTYAQGVFYNCTSISGGDGMHYSSSHTDADYAHVDTPEKPGYLTYKGRFVSLILTPDSFSYDGTERIPTFEIVGGKLLQPNIDYSIEVSDAPPISAGEYVATVTGLGQYEGSSLQASYSIVEADISKAVINLSEDTFTYSGKSAKPSAEVTLDSKTLASGTDYEMAYANNTNAGMATVTITGKGNYKGKASTSFRIKGLSISNTEVSSIAAQTYTGKPIKPETKVTLNGKTLISGTDYEMAYANNTNAGMATATITGKGNYAGRTSITFSINPASNTAKAAKTSVKKSIKTTTIKKKAQTIALPKVTTRFGKASWKVVTKDKKKVLTLKSGKVVVKKGAKKNTYTIKLKASVDKTKNYKAATTKTVTVKVTIK